MAFCKIKNREEEYCEKLNKAMQTRPCIYRHQLYLSHYSDGSVSLSINLRYQLFLQFRRRSHDRKSQAAPRRAKLAGI